MQEYQHQYDTDTPHHATVKNYGGSTFNGQFFVKR